MNYYLHPTNLTPKGKMLKNWPMTEAMDQDKRTMNPRIHEEDKEIMTSDGTHGYEYPPQHYPIVMDQMADNDRVLRMTDHQWHPTTNRTMTHHLDPSALNRMV